MIFPAVAENVVVAEPASTETVAGTVSVPELLESEMIEPPAGATADSWVVHIDAVPEVRLAGAHEIDFSTRPGGVLALLRFTAAL